MMLLVATGTSATQDAPYIGEANGTIGYDRRRSVRDATAPVPMSPGANPTGELSSGGRVPRDLDPVAALGPDGPRPARVPIECGDLPFVIRRGGTWLYRGSSIDRKELVCLFASV